MALIRPRRALSLVRLEMCRRLFRPATLTAARRRLSSHPAPESSTYITPKTPAPPPSASELRTYALRCAVPMVGFGFMDNTVMIHIGDALDLSLGVTFGLSTLTAAAFGQVFSDVAGVLFGGTIQELAERLGLPESKLTAEQESLREVRLLGTASAAGGVLVGCILGMVSLLFKDLGAAERAKRRKELATLFDALIEEGSEVLEAARCTLWLLDEQDKSQLWSKVVKSRLPPNKAIVDVFQGYDTQGRGFITRKEVGAALQKMGWVLTEEELGQVIVEAQQGPAKGSGSAVIYLDEFEIVVNNILNMSERAVPVRVGGIKHAVLQSGEAVRINNAQIDHRFNKEWDRFTGFQTRSILAVPVRQKDTGDVIGVIVAKNKLARGDQSCVVPFTDGDETVLNTIASHAAAFIKHVEDS